MLWKQLDVALRKPFFVTDKDLIKFGVAAEIIKVFDDNKIPYELYSDVKANPTIANVQNGVAAYKASGADFIVALVVVLLLIRQKVLVL